MRSTCGQRAVTGGDAVGVRSAFARRAVDGQSACGKTRREERRDDEKGIGRERLIETLFNKRGADGIKVKATYIVKLN